MTSMGGYKPCFVAWGSAIVPVMKFNDGFWLLKNGVRPYYGLQVTQTKKDAEGYELQVATKPVNHRGDTLGGL